MRTKLFALCAMCILCPGVMAHDRDQKREFPYRLTIDDIEPLTSRWRKPREQYTDEQWKSLDRGSNEDRLRQGKKGARPAVRVPAGGCDNGWRVGNGGVGCGSGEKH